MMNPFGIWDMGLTGQSSLGKRVDSRKGTVQRSKSVGAWGGTDGLIHNQFWLAVYL